MTFWNQAFDTPEYKYGTQPNAFVRAQAHRLPAATRRRCAVRRMAGGKCT